VDAEVLDLTEVVFVLGDSRWPLAVACALARIASRIVAAPQISVIQRFALSFPNDQRRFWLVPATVKALILAGNPMSENSPIFHLAFPIGNIPQAKEFYLEGLGCALGRETDRSLILNLGGHQLVGHLTQPLPPAQAGIYPRHFGLIYPGLEDWAALEQRAIERGLTFQQQSKRRFTGDITEHYSFFLVDPFIDTPHG
jgi:uncharacterized protein